MTRDYTGRDQEEVEYMIEVEPEKISKDPDQELDQDLNLAKPDM